MELSLQSVFIVVSICWMDVIGMSLMEWMYENFKVLRHLGILADGVPLIHRCRRGRCLCGQSVKSRPIVLCLPSSLMLCVNKLSYGSKDISIMVGVYKDMIELICSNVFTEVVSSYINENSITTGYIEILWLLCVLFYLCV